MKNGDVLIGQLAERVGVTTKSIRFYESISLLPVPARSGSGYRVYADVDVQRLAFIKTAQRLGLSLDEIREIIALRDRGEQPCTYVAEVLQSQVDVLDRRIHEMGQLRHELQELQAAAAAGDRGGRFCGAIEHATHEQRAKTGLVSRHSGVRVTRPSDMARKAEVVPIAAPVT
ncbi:MAG: heavy metal-responsive transcriptional regulator [Acidimicrobiales bacterium]